MRLRITACSDSWSCAFSSIAFLARAAIHSFRFGGFEVQGVQGFWWFRVRASGSEGRVRGFSITESSPSPGLRFGGFKGLGLLGLGPDGPFGPRTMCCDQGQGLLTFSLFLRLDQCIALGHPPFLVDRQLNERVGLRLNPAENGR